MADRLCANVTPVKYSEVLDVDRTIREFESEKAEKDRPTGSDPFSDPSGMLKSQFLNVYSEARKFTVSLSSLKQSNSSYT